LKTATINFKAIAAKTYGNSDFNVGASSNNTEAAITYASSNSSVATIDATGLVHITGAGTTIIIASQAASTNYNAAANALQTLTVNQAFLTITADNKIRNQGDTNPLFTVSYSGFVNGESVSALTTQPVISTTATLASSPGIYPIAVSGALATNYNISYINGAFIIKAFLQQVITFNALPVKTYGNTDFLPNATSNSTAQPIVYTSSNSSVATIVNGQIHIVGAGNVVITASQVGDSTHGVAVNQSQTLVVNKTSLIISANNQVRFVGQSNSMFTFNYNGFVNGETASVLTTQPVATTTATIASPAGAYPITVSGVVAHNYSINYVAGILTVNPLVAQVITFPVLPAKTYGDGDFAVGAISNNTTTALAYTSSNPTVATVVNGQLHIVGAGTAIITASQAASTGYSAAADVAQSLVVNKANLLLVADNKTKPEGQANPNLTISYNGFANGDNLSSLTTVPTISTTAALNSVIGNYPIVASGAVSANYNISYANGILSVIPSSANSNADIKAYTTSSSTLQVQVYVSNTVGVSMVHLIDMNGKVMYKKHEYLSQGNNSFVIPVNNAMRGIYYVLVTGNGIKLSTGVCVLR
jgi:hypothetical protein